MEPFSPLIFDITDGIVKEKWCSHGCAIVGGWGVMVVWWVLESGGGTQRWSKAQKQMINCNGDVLHNLHRAVFSMMITVYARGQLKVALLMDTVDVAL